tara:strand:+ start:10352 stop:10891 length:540 start_codon:yes stop_codon:yes gene_type:complete
MKLKLIKLNSVKSTNDEAIKLIKKNKLSPCLITAKRQTRGRGTMGKKWISEKGNLFISLFFQINSKNIKANKFSVLNPRIIKNILAKYSKNKISIKWPNDLLIKKRKLGGILQEVIEYRDKKFLIIGIGVNTKISPKNKSFNSISLSACSNRVIKNNEILVKIKLAYEKIISNLSKGRR